MPPAPRSPGRATAPLLARNHHPVVKIFIALVVVAALAALVAYLVVRITNRRAGHAPSAPMAAPAMAMAMPAQAVAADAALEQLRLRYARGDVSRSDYLQAAADLGAPVPPTPDPANPTNPA